MKIEPRDEFEDNPDSFMPHVTNVVSVEVEPLKSIIINSSDDINKKSVKSRPSVYPQQLRDPIPRQKVQIVRSADGKIQVFGLRPDQQVVKLPDGKLEIFSKPQPQKHAMTQTFPEGEGIARKAARVVAVHVPLAPGQQAPTGATVFKSGGKTYYLRRAAKPNQEN